ncbi:MAG: T9SS type A sorting domain-containing protein [Bacteroidales bacterium]|nr:T9SS type A sorting domain-containing protein [Bacteroidales bacterium]
MKTKMLISLFCAISIFHTLKSQTNYMPVFGDTTRFYYAMRVNDSEEFHYIEFKKTTDSTVIPIGYLFGCNYEYLEFNKTNSKIWGITQGQKKEKLLLMDLDMNTNDLYIDNGGNSHIVDSIYWENGRKHVRFENHELGLEIGGVKSSYFEFIEGVGNTITFKNDGIGTRTGGIYSSIPWLRSQYRNNTIDYGIAEWYGYWDYVTQTNLQKIFPDNKINVFPTLVESKLHFNIPDILSIRNIQIGIYDNNGKQHVNIKPTESKFILNVSDLAAGGYFVKIGDKNHYEIIKFIKR